MLRLPPTVKTLNFKLRHYRAGQPLDLTPNEYRLLSVLLKRPGRVYSRDALLDQLYDTDHEASDRSISHQKLAQKTCSH